MKSKTMKSKTSALVKGLRLELGLSQTEFAKRVGKPQSTIARIETGAVLLTIKLLREIATKVGKRLEIEFVEKV